MSFQLFVRKGEQQIPVEVAADATVGDLAEAARPEGAAAPPSLSYHGVRLTDPTATLADLGICPEAVVDWITTDCVLRWVPGRPEALLGDQSIRHELYDITNSGLSVAKTRSHGVTYDICADVFDGAWKAFTKCNGPACRAVGAVGGGAVGGKGGKGGGYGKKSKRGGQQGSPQAASAGAAQEAPWNPYDIGLCRDEPPKCPRCDRTIMEWRVDTPGWRREQGRHRSYRIRIDQTPYRLAAATVEQRRALDTPTTGQRIGGDEMHGGQMAHDGIGLKTALRSTGSGRSSHAYMSSFGCRYRPYDGLVTYCSVSKTDTSAELPPASAGDEVTVSFDWETFKATFTLHVASGEEHTAQVTLAGAEEAIAIFPAVQVEKLYKFTLITGN
eukprot:TRINITY_DN15839_c0_g6_i1.p1 TRINITY_DN15839_c0_g6~~TRINITY_DN15839_c0_g6_i1.p1  ORF type:complete len:414 (+),score=51.10 TRINITY_DN15839_c0_g6_i1:86-1243(+)